MTPPPAAALGTAGRVFFGSLCVGTGALGVWQTQRYFEKQELIAQRMIDLQRPPMSYRDYHSTLPGGGTAGTAAAGTMAPPLQRLHVQGRFRHDAEMYVGPRGPPAGAVRATGVPTSGYYVITPLVVDHNETLLINRGWIPRNVLPHNPKKDESKPDDETIRGPGHHQDYPYRHDKHFQHHNEGDDHPGRVAWSRPTGTVSLTVVPTPPEEPKYVIAQHNLETRPAVFFWYDVPSMVSVTQTDGIPVTSKDAFLAQVDADTTSAWPLVPTSATMIDGRLHPIMHAGYAVTWYGLCLAGLVMTRRLAKGGRVPPPP